MNCTLCPRNCSVDREKQKGFCGATSTLKIARAALHFWEEPCLSGEHGSGTIFFSHCNLKCIFCQNHEISSEEQGIEVSIERFSEICLELQAQGAQNINLVTPTHYVPQIIEGLQLAKREGLTIPIIYNTSAYETEETIASLEGLIDIYLPDLKYYDDTYAVSYSRAPHYFEVASKAIAAMVTQVGSPRFDQDGKMLKGVIVRHLLLPGLQEDSKKILSYLAETYHDQIYISIMNQYTPLREFPEYPNLNKKIDEASYWDIIDYACDLGIVNGFIQEGETCLESFIPKFDGKGV